MPIVDYSEVNQKLFSVYGEAIAAFSELGLEVEFSKIVTTPIEPEKCSQFFELCYANKDDLPEAVIDAAIEIGEYATALRFYGLGADGRGVAMLAAMSGGADGPEPVVRYCSAPPALAPVPPPPPGGED